MYLGIDATNWIHQLWHAHAGQGVLQAALQRAQALYLEWTPDVMIACFDRKSFRHAIASDYKSGRSKRDPALDSLLTEAPAAFANHEFIIGYEDRKPIRKAVCMIAAQDGYEADDCLATLAWIGRHHGKRVVLASPDKDLRQCLQEKQVGILRTFTTEAAKVKKAEWFTAADLRDMYGLEPHQWPDFQALVGDRSDSIIGCEGWGEKTAAAVLSKVGTLAKCLANPWQCPGLSDKKRDALFAFKPRAATVLDLVTLRTNVDVIYDAMR